MRELHLPKAELRRRWVEFLVSKSIYQLKSVPSDAENRVYHRKYHCYSQGAKYRVLLCNWRGAVLSRWRSRWRLWLLGKCLTSQKAAFGGRKYIGAAEYWRRWLVGKYTARPKVAFGARIYVGAAGKSTFGYLELYGANQGADAKAAMGTIKNLQHYRKLFWTRKNVIVLVIRIKRRTCIQTLIITI